VTIEELKDFREWDYSHLSFQEIDTAAMPIEI
jgi:hypothetical protein